jgi:hypothetical protein
MTSLLRRALAVLVASIVAAFAAAPASAFPVMTFDGYANNTAITNQYQAQGVLYSSFGGPCTIFLDAAEATSGSNILVGASNLRDIDIKMVDPVTAAPSASWRACHASMNVISVGWSVVTLTSRDGAGNALQSFTLTHPSGPRNGLGAVDHLEFNVGAIASISMNFTTVDFGDGIGLDDVVVDFDCTTPTRQSTWGAVKAIYR